MNARTALALALVSLLAACGKEPQPQPAVEVEGPAEPAEAGVPRPSQEAIAQLDAAFDEARALVDQARRFKTEAEEIQRTDGRQAANAKLKKASSLYRQALGIVSDVIEPELGPFTEDQVDQYLSQWTHELGKWQKEKAGLGRIHE